jgi:aerobic carbon-monoxide dehydrogenase small subunit
VTFGRDEEMLMSEQMTVELTVNGTEHRVTVPPRLLLADLLRERLGLTGTHLGCEQGVCGSCTVELNGRPVRSCLLFAVQADGQRIETIEGVASGGDALDEVQQAFADEHAMQCGFCTPGFVISTRAFLRDHPRPDRDAIVEMLGGHVCRCTGYQNIIKAVETAAVRRADRPEADR